jgi:hypothetical protein
VAHPRDAFFGYFDQYGMNHYNLQAEGSLLEWLPGINVNPVADPELFSGRFDALELFNSKRYELIRTPTAEEMRRYNLARKVIQASADRGASPDVIERELIELDRMLIKEMLHRTAAEQDAIWEATGSEGCDLYSFCTGDEDCEEGEMCDRDGTWACFTPCQNEADCSGAVCLDGKCDPGFPSEDSPCTSQEGIIDDWFRLLDYGVVRTGMGNSDTHQMFTQTEAGLPRNWVRSQAEVPKSIDRLDMVRNINAGRVVTSYGPFVEVWLGDAEVGETHTASPGATVPLRIRVQSPLWFDVDRVEVYRSGRLVHAFTGAGDETDPESQVDVSGLSLPNRAVTNLDAVLEETVPDRDAWYVVIAMGLEGRDLSPVYGEHPFLKLQIGDILATSLQNVPIGIEISSDLVPRVFRIYLYGVTNPVFLDTDGNGAYDAPNPAPAWAEGGRQTGSSGFPLSSSRIGKSPLGEASDADTLRVRLLRAFLSLLSRALE